MHPRVVQDKPGACSICGMTLVLQKKNENTTMVSGHRHGSNPSMGMEGHNHHAMMIADFKKRFYVVLILTIPIMLLSTMIQQFMGVYWQFTGSLYILFALSSIVFFYGGLPFLKKIILLFLMASQLMIPKLLRLLLPTINWQNILLCRTRYDQNQPKQLKP